MRSRTARISVAAISVATMVLALTSCGGTEQGGDNGDGQAIETFVVATPTEPDSLAAEQAKTTAGYAVLRNIEESLLSRDPETNELVGELATSWEQVNDTLWRFQLREGVTFHDGSAFNAEAAAFALDHEWDRDNVTILTSYLGPDLTFTATDEYTLDVTTAAPDPILPYRLFVSPIFSQEAYEKDPASYPLVPVGTGPYKFVEWQKGQSITLEANDDWWGNDAADAGGKISFPKAQFVFRPEPTVRSAMVDNDEAQFARWVTGEDCAAAELCASTPGVETIYLRPDMENPVLGDARIREAISLSINREQILDSILGGGQPAAQMVGSSAFGFNDELEPTPYDPDEAKKLVNEARADGVDVDGTTITLIARSSFIQRIDEISQVVADGLREAGLNVETTMREQVEFEEMLRTRPTSPERANLVLHSHGNELMDYGLSVNSYLLCNSVTGTYCDPRVEELTAQASQTFGEEREQLLKDIAAYVFEANATIPVGQPEFHYKLAPNLNWTTRMDGFILLKEITAQ